MDLGKIASGILGAVAPVLGTAIGGPFGGMVASKLSEVLLGRPDADPAELAQAIEKASPEQLVRIKELNNEFLVKMKELDVDIERLHAEDRSSARSREVQTRDWMPRALAFLIVFGFMATVFSVLLGYVDGMKDPLTATTVGTLIGFVSAKAEQVVSYYFGSSSSSQAKTALIAEQQQNNKK